MQNDLSSSRALLFGRRVASVGAFSAALAVALGALAAHELKSSLSSRLIEVFETAVRYQLYHAIALAGTGFALIHAAERSARALRWAAGLFIAGTLLFAGSLYGLCLTGVEWFGFATPFGGLAFIAGWCAAGIGLWRYGGRTDGR